jgi:hypothetical protein
VGLPRAPHRERLTSRTIEAEHRDERSRPEAPHLDRICSAPPRARRMFRR